jgi:hypothetical protein
MGIFMAKHRPQITPSARASREKPWPTLPREGLVLAFAVIVAIKLVILLWVLFGIGPALRETLGGA